MRIPLYVLILMALAFPAKAAKTTAWSGTGDWFSASANWSEGAPAEGDTAVLASGTVLLTNATPALAAFTNLGGVLAFSNWSARLAAVSIDLSGGTLQPVSAFSEIDMSNRVWLACSNLTVAAPAVIHADALGYLGLLAVGGQGPGKSLAATYRTAGAGHGGQGGRASDGPTCGMPYGDPEHPTDPGSSSAGRTQTGNLKAGKNGGGAIRIDAAGDILLAGRISADGAGIEGYIGGGSGGSILIHCRTIQGNGVVRADGGAVRAGLGGGEGGGGRIAIHYNAGAQQALGFPDLTVSAAAGKRDHHTDSQFGTLYFPDALVLRESVANIRGWLHIAGLTGWSPASLSLTNSYLGFLAQDFHLSIAGSAVGSGDRMLAFRSNAVASAGGDLASSILFAYGGSLSVDGNLRLPPTTQNNYHSLSVETDISASGAVALEGVWRYASAPTNGVEDYGSRLAAGSNMSLATASALYLYSNPTNGGSALLAMGSLSIATGSVISADGGGFDGVLNVDGYGPGGGKKNNTYAGGGGYGGQGGNGGPALTGGAGGVSNGLAYAPLNPGSAGGGRSTQPGDPGGGRVLIACGGTAVVEGTISANGLKLQPYAGAGSGGSLFIFAKSLTGGSNAVLRANGGARGSSNGGSGGGGRIAVWQGHVTDEAMAAIRAGRYDDSKLRYLAATNLASFAGTAAALKGTGTEDGAQDGTVFFITLLPPKGTLIQLY
jgi:hypothetical protein